jgi:hypothetical protein
MDFIDKRNKSITQCLKEIISFMGQRMQPPYEHYEEGYQQRFNSRDNGEKIFVPFRQRRLNIRNYIKHILLFLLSILGTFLIYRQYIERPQETVWINPFCIILWFILPIYIIAYKKINLARINRLVSRFLFCSSVFLVFVTVITPRSMEGILLYSNIWIAVILGSSRK